MLRGIFYAFEELGRCSQLLRERAFPNTSDSAQRLVAIDLNGEQMFRCSFLRQSCSVICHFSEQSVAATLTHTDGWEPSRVPEYSQTAPAEGFC